LAVITNLLLALVTCRRNEAVRVGAICHAVAVIVSAVAAVLWGGGAKAFTGGGSGAVRVGAVNEKIAVLVLAAEAIFGGAQALALRIGVAVSVVAVKETITVLIEPVPARADLGRETPTDRGTATIRVEAVYYGVAVVIFAVVADLSTGGGLAAAVRCAIAGRIEAVGDPVAVIVIVVVAGFERARKGRRVQVVAVSATTLERSKSITIEIEGGEQAGACNAAADLARVLWLTVKVELAVGR
jgi:hypothetical protein